MNYWEVLEIGPTIDVSAIKKAYARKLKICRPDDDPKGFQILRDAYCWALNYANKISNPEEEDDKGIVGLNRYIIKAEKTEEKTFDETDIISVKNEERIYEFLNKLKKLYDNFFERIELVSWKELFCDDIIWQLDLNETIGGKVFGFLQEHRYFPGEVWKFLNDTFHWDEKKKELIASYPKKFVDYLFLYIKAKRVPLFCYFDKNADIDYEEYLGYREQAFLALREMNIASAVELINQAQAIYQKDPDLYNMLGDYYYENGEFMKADAEFQKAMDINPEDMYPFYYKAQVYFDNGLHTNSLELCKFIILKKPDYFGVRLLIGECLFKEDKWKDAGEIFIDSLKKDQDDLKSKKYLNKIRDKYDIYLKSHQFSLIKRIEYIKLRRVFNECGDSRGINIHDFKEIVNIMKIIILIPFTIGLTIIYPFIGFFLIMFDMIMISRFVNKSFFKKFGY